MLILLCSDLVIYQSKFIIKIIVVEKLSKPLSQDLYLFIGICEQLLFWIPQKHKNS